LKRNDSKITDLISKMTLEEKLTILTGIDFWCTVPIERLGIPAIKVSDGPHGLRKVISGSSSETAAAEPSLCFPTSAAMAATWNRKLVYNGARAMGEISAAADIDVLLGPGVNIKRTPLCGRNFEYYSEDPYLTGELAVNYINGVQSAHVGTSLKHLAANNQEFDRFQISSEVDERTLREIYLPAFEKAVMQAEPWTVMCAYNRLNGVYCSEHRGLLQKILREEWGFEGIVVSDWWAVRDRSRSLKAGLELEMPYSEGSLSNLQAAYDQGYFSDTELDETLTSLLGFILKAAGSRTSRVKTVDEAVHREILLDGAREAITLLKNDEGILPIDTSRAQTILVLGHAAEEPAIQGGGSSEVTHTGADSPVEVLHSLSGPAVTIEYQKLYSIRRGMVQVDGLNKALTAARSADKVIFFARNNAYAETEGRDREGMTLPPSMEQMINAVTEVNPSTVVVLQAGSAVDMRAWVESVKGVLFTWVSGQRAGTAMAEVLVGKLNPSGKTAETFPLSIEDTPCFCSYPGNGFAAPYTEGLLVGYRHYDTMDEDVLFPFGHGLSYTNFEYSDVKVDTAEGETPFPVRVSCRIRNSGSMTGKETVQLYVRDLESRVLRPFQELKGFDKVELKPGEQTQVLFELDQRAFSYYSTAIGAWHWETGEFELRIGASSRDIRLKEIITLNNPDDLS
jgi:beta-glucosidase